MRRYEGSGVPAGSRIAVVANDAIGNFVVSTPLLQMLRTAHAPSTLDYFGGKRTIELQRASDLFDWSFPLHGSNETEALEAIATRKPYDMVVNVETSDFAKRMTEALCDENTFVVGPCHKGGEDLPCSNDAQGKLSADREWISEDVTKRHPILTTGFIGEIFCRLAYLEGPIPRYKVPCADPDTGLPNVLIATAASLPEKLWPIDNWCYVLSKLQQRGARAGLLGAKPSDQMGWKGAESEQRLIDDGLVDDFRGMFTMPQVVGALSKVCAVLTIDNGILHLATAAETPTVGLFRHGIHRLWAPPSSNLTVLTAGEGYEVSEIGVDRVLEAIELAL